MLISAKYGEKTYPGVLKLNQIIQSPFTYDEFILMETDILNTLKWEVFIMTPYIFTHHMIAQGILFTSDTFVCKSTGSV